ncbi:Homeodomain-like protein, partial [Chytriomyces sp. MP71]
YHKWSPEEDEILRSAILRVTKNNVADVAGKWVRISQLVPGRTPIQCSARWTGALNSDIVRGKWTAREDKLLVTAVAEERARVERVDASGTTRVSDADLNWQRIACCVAGRTGVQCAARYQEALDPDIRKGKWLSEEDALLRQGILAHGKSWVKIAAAIPNRTQRQCRTRWLQI